MKEQLVIIYLDRKEGTGLIDRLELTLHPTFHPVTFVSDGGILNVLDVEDVWHYIPLANVKQYYKRTLEAKSNEHRG